MKIIFPITILIFFICFNIFAHETNIETKKDYRIAILDFKPGTGVSAQEAKDITNIIRTYMIHQNAFTILDRENLNKILEEQKNIQLGICDSSDCNIRLGRLVGANKIMTGKIFKLGRTYNINAYLTDIEKGNEETAELETSPSIDKIPIAIQKLTYRMTDLILNPDKQRVASETILPSETREEPLRQITSSNDFSEGALYFSYLIPGSGQFYNGYQLKGSLFFVTFFGLLGFDRQSYQHYHSAKSRYHLANTLLTNSYIHFNSTTYSYLQSVKEHSNKEMVIASQQIAFASTFLILVYIYNVIDAMLITEPKQAANTNSFGNSGFFINSKVDSNSYNMNRNVIHSLGYSIEF